MNLKFYGVFVKELLLLYKKQAQFGSLKLVFNEINGKSLTI